jgi:trk system potassium uptake protein
VQKRLVAYYVGQLFLVLAFFMLAPLALAYVDGSEKSLNAYTLSTLMSMLIGFGLRFLSFKYKAQIGNITRKDAFGIVAFGWIGAGFISGLPLLIDGTASSLSSATFEAISGLTTTGATILEDFESVSRATHLWRLLLHWIGGMGIVVLFVAIFPQMGLSGKQLFKTEVAGPITEGLKPRIKQTALRLWWIYLFFTLLCATLLHLAGLTIYESIGHAFSTLSTGGFSTQADSIGAFKNPMVEWIVIVFMLIGGINFGLYYGLFRGQYKKITRNTEVRFFIAINLFVSLLIFVAGFSWDMNSWHDDLRSALFQTIAVTTTTGLMTGDFDTYPLVSKYLLFLCMFVGGCAGSTSGGLKVSRVLIVFKRCIQELRLTLHPQEVVSTKLGRQTIPRRVISSVFIFVCSYFLLYIFGVFLMFSVGLDWVSASSSVVAAFSSVGPGFGAVGPTQNYEFVPALGKYILCFYMIAGRLEIFVLLTLFTPSFWRKG